MKYRRFGRLGWLVSEVGTGMWGMASWSGADEVEVKQALQRAVDLGCTFFDTAWAYGSGRSEGLLGDLVRANPDKKLFTATKIPPRNRQWPSHRTSTVDECYPPDHIEEYVRRSLANAGLPAFDLIQFHTWEDAWPGAATGGCAQATADSTADSREIRTIRGRRGKPVGAAVMAGQCRIFLTAALSRPTLLSAMNNAAPADNIVLRQTMTDLQRCLPSHWTSAVSAKTNDAADARLTIKTPSGASAAVAVRARQQLDPKFVPSVTETLKATAADGFLVVAPFLGERTRARLGEAGVGYIDLTGNMRLCLDRPTVFIHASGAARSPWQRGRNDRALGGAKACRLIRALCDGEAPFGVRALAAAAGTDPGYVSRLLDQLDREELVTRTPRGPVTAVDVAGLLRRWAVDYRFEEANRALLCAQPHGVPGALARLRGGAFPYALTARAGAAALLDAALPVTIAAYVDNPERVARAVGARPVDDAREANLALLQPYDRVVFDGTWERDGLRFAAQSQIVADLLGSRSPGPAQADAVLAKPPRQR